jgi:inosine/xanthosine triphosphatase
MKIIVGSESPPKIEATREAFGLYFGDVNVEGISVNSGVGKQPIGFRETFKGAYERAINVWKICRSKEKYPEYYVGIEGGAVKINDSWFSFGAICITNSIDVSMGNIGERLSKGEELGDLIDEITGKKDSKREGGATEFFTKGRLDRRGFYVPGIIVAMSKFVNKEIYDVNPVS